MRVMNEETLNKLANYIKQYMHDNNEVPSLMALVDYIQMNKSVINTRTKKTTVTAKWLSFFSLLKQD